MTTTAKSKLAQKKTLQGMMGKTGAGKGNGKAAKKLAGPKTYGKKKKGD